MPNGLTRPSIPCYRFFGRRCPVPTAIGTHEATTCIAGRERTVELREGLRIRYQDRAARVKKIGSGMVCMVYDEEPDSKTWYHLSGLKHALGKGELTVSG